MVMYETEQDGEEMSRRARLGFKMHDQDASFMIGAFHAPSRVALNSI